MSKQSCEGCAHWKRHEVDGHGYLSDGKANPDDFGECSAVVFDYWSKTGKALAYIMDGSQYHAELNTRRDFYCANFKEKDETNDKKA